MYCLFVTLKFCLCLAKLFFFLFTCLNIRKIFFSGCGFRKGRGTRDQIANSLGKFKKKFFFFLNKFYAPFSLSLSFPSKTSVMQLLVHSLLYKSLKLPLLKQKKNKKQKKKQKKTFLFLLLL